MSNLIFALLAILVSVTIAPPVQATTISLVPHPPKVHVPPPANVSVDIMISDLPTVLAAFDVEIVYDYCPLTFGFTCDYLIPTAGGSLGDRLGDPDPAAKQVVVDASTTDGIFRLIEVSLLDATELATLQTDPTTGNLLDSFRLATLNFVVPGSDSSRILIYFATDEDTGKAKVTLSDADGNSIEPVTVVDTSIIVSEPTTLSILLFGLVGLMFSALHRLLISLIIVLGVSYSLLGNVANAQAPDPYPHTGYVYFDYRSEPDDKVDEILNLLTQPGINIKYIHGEMVWAQVQQKPSTESGAFDWSLYDKFFTKLANKGLKIYLSLGAGVDGSINAMPGFLFRRSWSIDLGQDVNKITWNSVSNEVNFQYTGSN